MQSSTIATASEEMSGNLWRYCPQLSLRRPRMPRKPVTQTHTGAEIVQRSGSLMEAIAKRVNESSNTVEGLGQRSNQIGAIVNTIQDIADQTNLLALNAAH